MDNIFNFRTINEQKTNEKNTKNKPFEKHEFVEFALNEQKRETKKIFQEIIKNYPQITDEINHIFLENEKIKNENNILFNENLELGALVDELKLKLKSNDVVVLKKKINSLNQELFELKNRYSELENIALKNIETLKKLEIEYHKILKENKQFKEKRGFFSVAKDKISIGFYENENKELRKKLERVGRVPITSLQIKKIIELYNEGLGYGKIAEKTQVAKSTVSKYVQLYLKGKLNDLK